MKNNFRVLLAKQRKKVSDVHEATGVSKTTLTALYYERTNNPETETLLKVAKYLGVTLDELLTPEEQKGANQWNQSTWMARKSRIH